MIEMQLVASAIRMMMPPLGARAVVPSLAWSMHQLGKLGMT